MHPDIALQEPVTQSERDRGLAGGACRQMADAHYRDRRAIRGRERSAQAPDGIPGRAERQQQIGNGPGGTFPEGWGSARQARKHCGESPMPSIGASGSSQGARRTNTASRMPRPAAATRLPAAARSALSRRSASSIDMARASALPSDTVSDAPAAARSLAIPAQLLI